MPDRIELPKRAAQTDSAIDLGKPRLALALLVPSFLVVQFLKVGMWPSPNIRDQFDVAKHATVPNPDASFAFHSYIQPGVFWLLGGRSLNAYVLFCSFLTVAFLVLLLHIAIGYHPLAGVAVLTFPATMIPFYWIGMDGVTLMLMIAVSITLHSRWSWLWAFILSCHHFEQGALGFAILGVTLVVAKRREDAKRVTLLLLPFVIGRVALLLYLRWLDIHVLSDRLGWAWKHLREYIPMFALSPWAIVWSLFGAGWLLLLVRFRQAWPMFLAAGAALIPLLTVTDQTRVGVLILFPALVYWVIFNREFWRQCSPAGVAMAVVVYLLTPPVYVWGGYACGRYTTHSIERFRTQPSVSKWTDLDYIRPFVYHVCGLDRKVVNEAIRTRPEFELLRKDLEPD